MPPQQPAAEALTPQALYQIASHLGRSQRAVLRRCGEQLRAAANQCAKTIRITPLLLYPARHLRLLGSSFKDVRRLVLQGDFTDDHYATVLGNVDAAAFFGRLEEVDLLGASANALFLSAMMDAARSLRCLKAPFLDSNLSKLEVAACAPSITQLHIKYAQTTCDYGSDEPETFPAELEDLGFLSRLASLEALRVEGELEASVLDTLPVANLAALSSLALRSCTHVSLDLAPLQGLAALQQLDLQVYIAPATFEQLLQLEQQLEQLSSIKLTLGRAADADGADMAALLPRLTELQALVELRVPSDSRIYLGQPLPQQHEWALPEGLTRLELLDKLAREGVDGALKVWGVLWQRCEQRPACRGG